MSDAEDNEVVQFHEMGLDDRILKAIAGLGWAEPTLIQEKAIPLALEGKDILARARTGSGKTAAFAIPVIQKILTSKQLARHQCVKSIILTPTKELCKQGHKNIIELTSSCSREVRCVDVSGQGPLDAQRPLLMEQPDIVVGTPSRILAHIQAKNLNLKESIEMVVIDEADLVFSHGYEKDVKALMQYLPKIFQAFLMSATLSDEVKSLKKLLLHNPVVLKLEESRLPETNQLTQYHIKCEENDKFVLIYTLIKLALIRGKSIIFVNHINKCYRVKLFLEQFGIPSCVLNSELPVQSRCHIVNQFNEGLYDIIIAADEVTLEDASQTKTVLGSKKIHKDQESGVSRGIDFKFVSNVVNFDFPLDVDSYIHRVGRTARGRNQGTALSFVSASEATLLEEVEAALAHTHPEGESLFKPYNFKMNEIEGFRYRATDAMRAVTKVAIREARLKEIRTEMMNSNKLKSYFEDNPRDFQLLRHDKALHTARLQPHLKNVPDYLVPPTLKAGRGYRGACPKGAQSSATGAHSSATGAHSSAVSGTSKKKTFRKPGAQGHRNFKKRAADPLNSFQFTGLPASKKKKWK